MKKLWKVFWGVFFVLAAVYLLASNIWELPKIGVLSLLLTICCLAMAIDGMLRLNFWEILFGAAFICCLNDKLLKLEMITPWPVLGAALFGSIGLSILFKRRKKTWNKSSGKKEDQWGAASETCSGEEFAFKNTFGAAIKYINSDHFRSIRTENRFGSMTIYLDNAVIQEETASVQIENFFGETVLFIPKEWRIKNNMKVSLGNVEERNHCEGTSAHTLIICGETNFGAVVINYI